MLRTPSTVSLKIAELCRTLNPLAQPDYIPISPAPGCDPSECFLNVRRKVLADGGKIQFGWAIWEWPRVFIEAEHHAVYAPPGGKPWLDITPSANLHQDHSRLFLPDDKAVYDFENEGLRRDNVRVAVADDPLVHEFFQLAQERTAILNAVPGVGIVTLSGATAERYQHTENRMGWIQTQLALKYTAQGARCPCGSGLKFKRCHGKSA